MHGSYLVMELHYGGSATNKSTHSILYKLPSLKINAQDTKEFRSHFWLTVLKKYLEEKNVGRVNNLSNEQ